MPGDQIEADQKAALLQQQANERAYERDRQFHNDEIVKPHDPS